MKGTSRQKVQFIVSNTVKKTGMKRKPSKQDRQNSGNRETGIKETNQSLKSANQEAAGNCESIQFSGKILISTYTANQEAERDCKSIQFSDKIFTSIQLTKKQRETVNLYNSAAKSSYLHS